MDSIFLFFGFTCIDNRFRIALGHTASQSQGRFRTQADQVQIALWEGDADLRLFERLLDGNGEFAADRVAITCSVLIFLERKNSIPVALHADNDPALLL